MATPPSDDNENPRGRLRQRASSFWADAKFTPTSLGPKDPKKLLAVVGKVQDFLGLSIEVTFAADLPPLFSVLETVASETRIRMVVYRHVNRITVKAIAEVNPRGLLIEEDVINLEKLIFDCADLIEVIPDAIQAQLDWPEIYTLGRGKKFDSEDEKEINNLIVSLEKRSNDRVGSVRSENIIGKSKYESTLEHDAERMRSAIEDALKEAGVTGIDLDRVTERVANNLSNSRNSLPSTAKSTAQVVDLPAKAPEEYKGLRGPETPPQFIQRVYGEWLGHGLTRAHVRKLDPKLYEAINNWLSRPGNEWPAEVDLPTKAEQNTRDLEMLRSSAAEGSMGRVLGDFTAKEAGRLRSALQRRGNNQKE